MNTEKEFTIFIQRVSRSFCGPDGSYAFTGTKAVYNDRQKLYREDGIEYKFRAKSIAALENASPGDVYKVTAKEVLDPVHGYQWQVIAAEQLEPAVIQEIRKFLMHYIRDKSLTPQRCNALVTAYKEKTLDTILENISSLDILDAKPDIKERIYHAIAENRSFAGLLRFLASRRLDCRLALQLYEKYQSEALSKLREDPYMLYSRFITFDPGLIFKVFGVVSGRAGVQANHGTILLAEKLNVSRFLSCSFHSTLLLIPMASCLKLLEGWYRDNPAKAVVVKVVRPQAIVNFNDFPKLQVWLGKDIIQGPVLNGLIKLLCIHTQYQFLA